MVCQTLRLFDDSQVYKPRSSMPPRPKNLSVEAVFKNNSALPKLEGSATGATEPFQIYPGDDLLSRTVTRAVPWASLGVVGLTSVVGSQIRRGEMGTRPPIRSTDLRPRRLTPTV